MVPTRETGNTQSWRRTQKDDHLCRVKCEQTEWKELLNMGLRGATEVTTIRTTDEKKKRQTERRRRQETHFI